MINQEQIREKIIQEIKYSGLSQTKIAALIGIKQQTISEYINGKSMPALDTFANLCLILELDANEILCLNQQDNIKNTVVYNHSTHNGNNNF